MGTTMSSLATLHRLFADSEHGDDSVFEGRRASRDEPNAQVPSAAASNEVARLKAGDAALFEHLFRRHYLPLRRFARMVMASVGDEEDIVEEIFTWLWESRERLDIRGSVESYLYSAVRHRALNLLRNRRKQLDLQARFSGELERPEISANESSGFSDADDLLTRVRAVIAGLPERRRLVLTLRWEGGLSNAEIAKTLGIAPQSVANLVQRALADVRAALPNEFR